MGVTVPVRICMRNLKPVPCRRATCVARAVADVPAIQAQNVQSAAPVTKTPEESFTLADEGMGSLDIAVESLVKPLTPEMTHFTRLGLVTLIVCSVTAAFGHAVAAVAHAMHKQSMKQATPNTLIGKEHALALFLRPLAIAIPIIAYLLASHNLLQGIEYMCKTCATVDVPSWVLNNAVLNGIYRSPPSTASLRAVLDNGVAIVFLSSVTWTVLLIKHAIYDKVISGMSSHTSADMKRSLSPVNTLASWLIVALSALMGLKIVGLDPTPILAVGSVSSMIVGFASQQLLMNLMAGISIFVTEPFIVGDIVDVKQDGVLIVSGTVARISPLRTTFLDEKSQSVTLPNKLMSDVMVTNHGDNRLLEPDVIESSPGKLEQILHHSITLTRPPDANKASYEEFANKLITALKARLQTLPNTKQSSLKVFVSDLTAKGEIVVQVKGVAVQTAAPEVTRQSFLVAIHSVYHTVLAEETAPTPATTVPNAAVPITV